MTSSWSCKRGLFLFSVIFFILLQAVSAANDSTTNLIRRLCGGFQVADPPAYDVSFIDAMETIFRSISASHFGSSSSGSNITNRVYGLGQCLNYLSGSDCGLCYAESRGKVPLCLPSSSGRVYMGACFLRYDSYNFSQESVTNYDSSVCGSSGNLIDDAEFTQITTRLIQNLTLAAYQATDYYNQANAWVSTSINVYGVAQCWRSLNKTGCRQCLESARNRTLACLPRSDGRALNTGCFLRYSLEPFYMPNSSSTGASSRSRSGLPIALGVTLAFVVVIAALILLGLRRFSAKDDYKHPKESSQIYKMISKSHLNYKYDELIKATQDFSLENKLGEGGYGAVYKGILPDKGEIAVKRLFFNTAQWVDQFFNEVNLVSQIQHKNLVRLLGCSVQGPESLLIYDYIPNSSLDRFLFDPYRKKHLDWDTRFAILVGTAEGLAYLHEGSDIRIIHRDIKASNVLLDELFRPKIADFGLARYFAEGQSHLSTGIAGTIGYMAPEYIIHGQLTEKADVYSYGVLVLEILTGRRNASPVSSVDGQSLVSQIWDLFGSIALIEMVDADLHAQCSKDEVLTVFQVGLLCTQASPDLRPPMKRIVEMLSTAYADLPLPTEPPFMNFSGLDFLNSNSRFTDKFGSSSKSVITNVNPISASHLQVKSWDGRGNRHPRVENGRREMRVYFTATQQLRGSCWSSL